MFWNMHADKHIKKSIIFLTVSKSHEEDQNQQQIDPVLYRYDIALLCVPEIYSILLSQSY